jgi:hypothetical protein
LETLQRMVRTLATERVNFTAAQAEIERLRLIVQKLQRSQFGRRAERLDDGQLQFGFEDSTPISRGSKPRFHQRRSRGRDRGPIDQACRRICPAKTCGSISSITRAPAAAASPLPGSETSCSA